jgi:hypothetical protein
MMIFEVWYKSRTERKFHGQTRVKVHPQLRPFVSDWQGPEWSGDCENSGHSNRRQRRKRRTNTLGVKGIAGHFASQATGFPASFRFDHLSLPPLSAPVLFNAVFRGE